MGKGTIKEQKDNEFDNLGNLYRSKEFGKMPRQLK
jgi:hypothetical protein